MKKKKEKESVRPIALAIILGALFIFSFKTANAAVVSEQLGSSNFEWAGANAFRGEKIISFPATTTIYEGEILLNATSTLATGIVSTEFDIYFSDGFNPVAYYKPTSFSNGLLKFRKCTNAMCTAFDSSGYQFSATTTYYFVTTSKGGKQYGGIYGSINAGSFSNGNITRTEFSEGSGTLADIYFRFFDNAGNDGDTIVPNQNGSYIEFTFPTDGMNVLFNSGFEVRYLLNASTTGNYVACANYATTTNFDLGNQTCVSVVNPSSSPFFSINKNQNDPPADYYAQAFISTTATSGVTQIIATSTIIQYTQTNSDPFTATSTTPANEDIDSTCAATTFFSTAIVGCIGEMFVWTFHQIFYPHDFSTIALKQTFANFKTIFPFNLFFNFNQLTTDALEANLNQAGADLTIQVFPGNAATVEVLSSTGLQDFVGISSKNLIFTVLINLIWIGIAFKIIRTVT